jgi:hypothetical protein
MPGNALRASKIENSMVASSTMEPAADRDDSKRATEKGVLFGIDIKGRFSVSAILKILLM